MMYSAGFVVVVKNQNDQILRENRNKEVFLPFNSQYSLLLKNKNNRRAVASVYIDGTDVLGGQRVIIEPNSDFNLERFCIDGDLSSGKRFKFVDKNHPDVQDPTSSELGQIRVRFWLEKDKPFVIQPSPWIAPGNPWMPYNPWEKYGPTYDYQVGDFPGNQPYTVSCYNVDSVSFSAGGAKKLSRSGDTDTGGTVEGSHSKQSFNIGYVDELEHGSTDIVLQLCASKQSVTVRDSRHIYCSACGSKNLRSSNFCTNCGARLVK